MAGFAFSFTVNSALVLRRLESPQPEPTTAERDDPPDR
jgi:hypothetical protein